MLNLNTINRIIADYNLVRNRQNVKLLNFADEVRSTGDRHDKQDRRYLPDRRLKQMRVLLEQRSHRERRNNRPDTPTTNVEHSIDTSA